MAETENKDYYREMYSSVWLFHKKYINGICDDDEFWDTIISESNQIAEQYHGDKFIIGLLLNEIDEMERIHKARRKDNR